jgi:hypothetical protein
MTTMHKVKHIKAEIAALPPEYKALFQSEPTWPEEHPLAYASILILVGGAATMIGVILALTI